MTPRRKAYNAGKRRGYEQGYHDAVQAMRWREQGGCFAPVETETARAINRRILRLRESDAIERGDER